MAGVSGLLGDAYRALEEQMHFRLARQSALASNLVNADTPGYRRIDLTFREELESAATRLRSTAPGHLSLDENSAYRVEKGPRGQRPDGNGVSLDYEMVQVARNAGAFMDQASVVARLVALRRHAISDR